MVIADDPRDVKVQVPCHRYYWRDAAKQEYNPDENWVLYNNLKIKKDEKTGDLRTDIEYASVIQGQKSYKWWWYNYIVDAGVEARPDGNWYGRVELNDKKGLGQQFLIRVNDQAGKALDITWVMPNEWCYSPRTFNISDVDSIQYLSRQWFEYSGALS